MADDKELRAGLFSGFVAGVMVLALTAMALMSFDPARASPPSYAGVNASSFASVADVARLSR